MSMSSTEPKITENKKGLLVSFNLIGAQLNYDNVNPALTVQIGDLNPHSTVSVRWIMTCSLTGQFISYAASFTNENPIGRSDVSLIDNVTIYELIHSVRIDYPSDDGKKMNERKGRF